MSHNVFAGNWQVAGKAGMNKSIARFPDVCLSPPSPPAGPIPVPYPDTSFSTDLKKGSKTVKVGNKPAALKQQSYYKPSMLGNEAATRTFGASVITHQITGKTYFQAWSMDVKFEGKNVCRHIDITTSNHACNPPATPPAPSAETQTMAEAQDAVDNGKCPCCGEDLHDWQKDASDNAYPPIKEDDFWQKRIDALDPTDKKKKACEKRFSSMKAAKAKSRADVAAGGSGCPNVHPSDEQGCALYFDVPPGTAITYKSKSPTKPDRQMTTAQYAKRKFEDRDKAAVLQAMKDKYGVDTSKTKKLNHKTPSMAGGCNDPNNLAPDNSLTEKDCNDIESWQSGLESMLS